LKWSPINQNARDEDLLVPIGCVPCNCYSRFCTQVAMYARWEKRQDGQSVFVTRRHFGKENGRSRGPRSFAMFSRGTTHVFLHSVVTPAIYWRGESRWWKRRGAANAKKQSLSERTFFLSSEYIRECGSKREKFFDVSGFSWLAISLGGRGRGGGLVTYSHAADIDSYRVRAWTARRLRISKMAILAGDVLRARRRAAITRFAAWTACTRGLPSLWEVRGRVCTIVIGSWDRAGVTECRKDVIGGRTARR